MYQEAWRQGVTELAGDSGEVIGRLRSLNRRQLRTDAKPDKNLPQHNATLPRARRPDFTEMVAAYFRVLQERSSQGEGKQAVEAIRQLNLAGLRGALRTFRWIDDPPSTEIFVEADATATELWQWYVSLHTIRPTGKQRVECMRRRNEFVGYVVSVSAHTAERRN
ncbi:MAG: hypothetical protein IMX01_09890 [Limnochordaceae bacterium]|nr:hypothetical protein [Limnochordaceae bacterium]